MNTELTRQCVEMAINHVLVFGNDNAVETKLMSIFLYIMSGFSLYLSNE